MVGDDINHDPHFHAVCSFYQIREGLLISKVVIDLVPVSGPIAVVASLQVVNDWRDPNGIESHILNVLEVFCEATKVTATIISKVATTFLAT